MTPEPAWTRAGSKKLVHHKCKMRSHLHTRPTKHLIPPSCTDVRLHSGGIWTLDSGDWIVARFHDFAMIHKTLVQMLSPLPLDPDTPSLLR